MSSMLSSQSGRLDRPKPGCDGTIRRRLRRQQRDELFLRTEALAAVQPEQRCALPGLEQFEVDSRDLDCCCLQWRRLPFHRSPACRGLSISDRGDKLCKTQTTQRGEECMSSTRLGLRHDCIAFACAALRRARSRHPPALELGQDQSRRRDARRALREGRRDRDQGQHQVHHQRTRDRSAVRAAPAGVDRRVPDAVHPRGLSLRHDRHGRRARRACAATSKRAASPAWSRRWTATTRSSG